MSIIAAPDLATLQLCSILSSCAFGSVFLLLWLQRRKDVHLLLWSGSSLLYAAVLLSFGLLPANGPLMLSVLLFAILACSNALIVAGVNQVRGEAPFRSWMALPIAVPALAHLVPRLLSGDGLPIGIGAQHALDSLGLAISIAFFGLALVRGGDEPGARGRRITGAALLAYIPAYLVAVGGAFLLPDAALLPKVPLIADQLLLAIVNLGPLAMIAERAQLQLREAALRDPLTGSWNRTGLQMLEDRLVRPGSQLLAIDVDHFKQINDRHGHAAGDRVLRALSAEVARLAARDGGHVARIGGDEFVVVLPETERNGAVRLADRIREAIGDCDPDLLQWTVSLGWATVLAGEDRLAPALARADASLYRAKARGRDQLAA